MKIVLASSGTRGDLQPILALASALLARGHDARVAGPPNFQEWFSKFGVPFAPLGIDWRVMLREFGTNVAAAAPVVRDEVRIQFRALLDIARGADLLVGASVIAAGPSIAELLGIPYKFVIFSPSILPSPAHASPLWPWVTTMPGWANNATWRAWGVLASLLYDESVDRERMRLGLPRVPLEWKRFLTDRPLLAADPAIAPRADPGHDALQVGQFVLDDDTPLDARVEEFLAAGSAPVYFGFGSMGDKRPDATTALVFESARRAGVRAIVSSGWGEIGGGQVPRDVLVVDAVPHAKLFPRLLAIVHHGGAGTTHAAARAGVPQVLVPHLLDQFYWGERIEKLGVGRMSWRPTLTQDKLVRALKEVRVDAVRARATELASRMTTDGIARAVREIETNS